jgi:hypothetical protein
MLKQLQQLQPMMLQELKPTSSLELKVTQKSLELMP